MTLVKPLPKRQISNVIKTLLAQVSLRRLHVMKFMNIKNPNPEIENLQKEEVVQVEVQRQVVQVEVQRQIARGFWSPLTQWLLLHELFSVIN